FVKKLKIMERLFNKEKYIQRRKQLKEKVGFGVIFMPGNFHLSMNYPANPLRFRQDSNFLYFFGLDSPELAGVIDVDNDEELLFGPEFSVDDLIWTGQVEMFDQRAFKVGVSKVFSYSKLERYIKKTVEEKRKIHFLPPYQGEKKIVLSEMLGFPVAKLKEQASDVLIKAVVAIRSKKDADEVDEIEYALNNITAEIYRQCMSVIRPGIKESEFASIAEGYALKHNCRLAYPAICTVNGQYLHNESYDNILKDGQLLLIDAGSESPMHYASDITRTIPVSKKFNTQQKEIYLLVLDMQQKALSLMKPGVPYSFVHKNACEVLVKGMIQLGLMKGNVAEVVEAGAHALFFPHGLGHLLGLDVHDMEDLGEANTGYDETYKRSQQFGTRFLRYGKELHEGIVITVEPGIYFIPELIDQWKSESRYSQFINYAALEKYKNFGGIRIEDNVLITNDNYKILGNLIPKSVFDVEAACNL
ncbi:MAG TPA: aminopeptidase P family protein, partial [Bacteroidales bacterium]